MTLIDDQKIYLFQLQLASGKKVVESCVDHDQDIVGAKVLDRVELVFRDFMDLELWQNIFKKTRLLVYKIIERDYHDCKKILGLIDLLEHELGIKGSDMGLALAGDKIHDVAVILTYFCDDLIQDASLVVSELDIWLYSQG